MITKLTLLAAAVLVVTPAAVTVMVPGPVQASALRSVEMTEPVEAFTQLQNRIQIRLRPAASAGDHDTRKRVILQDGDGDEITIPLKPGQTWASVELPANIASASLLIISVE
ncbi:MAG: hypothetical protein ABL956_16590 [Hyphomonadaceae bacterium]